MHGRVRSDIHSSGQNHNSVPRQAHVYEPDSNPGHIRGVLAPERLRQAISDHLREIHFAKQFVRGIRSDADPPFLKENSSFSTDLSFKIKRLTSLFNYELPLLSISYYLINFLQLRVRVT